MGQCKSLNLSPEDFIEKIKKEDDSIYKFLNNKLIKFQLSTDLCFGAIAYIRDVESSSPDNIVDAFCALLYRAFEVNYLATDYINDNCLSGLRLILNKKDGRARFRAAMLFKSLKDYMYIDKETIEKIKEVARFFLGDKSLGPLAKKVLRGLE
ncbi:hypothetical protein ACFLY7_02485 [Patescibacteria group bacterium]